MSKVVLGNCAFWTSELSDSHKLDRVEIADPEADIIERQDRVLHRWLSKIFHERSCLSSGEIKELLRVPGDDADSQSSIIKVILTRHFSKAELDKFSLLWIAILGWYQNSAELLVRSGADVCELLGPHGRGEPIDEKWTVLHVLLQVEPPSRNERLVRLIMDHGVDVQARDSRGQTVLHVAVWRGLVQAIEMLLEKGADVNAADDEGVTALLAAAGSRKADELLPLLMKRGADVLAKDTFGQNVLHYLALAPNMEYDVLADLARVFIEKGVSLDDRDSRDQYQPLHVAAYGGKHELVELYLDHGANANARALYGYVPLYLAALPLKWNTSRTLRILLERGANVDVRSCAGRIALHAACENFSEANIKILLYAGADLLTADWITLWNGSETPLDVMYGICQDAEDPSVRLALKTLALKKVRLPSIKLTDKMIVERYPEYWDYYRDCVEQVERTKCAKFFGSWTFFDLLEKCYCQLAERMRNPEFGSKFKNKYDVTEFSMYAEDIVRAFKRAEHHYHSMLEQQDVISEALYDILPPMIVRRVAHYMLNCENVK